MSGIFDDWFGIEKPTLDVSGTADKQYQLNLQALKDGLKASSMDQTGPFGSVSWARDSSGNPTGQNVTLSPRMQSYYDSLFSQAGAASGGATNLAKMLSGGVDTSGVPDTSNIAKTSYDRQLSLMQPELDRSKTALDVEMSNRGLPVGSEIWNNERNRFDTAKNTALTNASRTADLDATTEQQRQIQNELSKYQTNTGAMSAMNSATPNLTGVTPTAVETRWTQPATTDYTGLAKAQYGADQAGYGNAMNGLSKVGGSLLEGLGGISGIASKGASALAFLSDENTKENRHPADGEKILLAFRDMPVDDYRYKGSAQREMGVPERRTGPMAQDYAEHFPEGSDGHMIDMGDAMGKILAAIKALDKRTSGPGQRSERS